MQPHAAEQFERFSDDIRAAMRIANREAIRHLQPAIDTPHLLVALLKEPTGLGGALLRHKALTVKQARKAVRNSTRRAWEFHIFRKLPLTAGLDAVVGQAIDYAHSEKHDAVGTGGVLLAMLRHDSRTQSLLRSMGVDIGHLQKGLAGYLHRFMVEAPGQVLHLNSADRPAA